MSDPSPPSTLYNGRAWRIWHSLNYTIGGLTFLIGSMILFPYFSPLCNNATVSAWLYSVGSFCFLLADLTEWYHYESFCSKTVRRCSYPSFSFNFALSWLGSLTYLVGSIFFLPFINFPVIASYLFIVASAIIAVAQIWKLIRSGLSGERTFWQNTKNDLQGFLVDAFALVGASFYFYGTNMFMDNI